MCRPALPPRPPGGPASLSCWFCPASLSSPGPCPAGAARPSLSFSVCCPCRRPQGPSPHFSTRFSLRSSVCRSVGQSVGLCFCRYRHRCVCLQAPLPLVCGSVYLHPPDWHPTLATSPGSVSDARCCFLNAKRRKMDWQPRTPFNIFVLGLRN